MCDFRNCGHVSVLIGYVSANGHKTRHQSEGIVPLRSCYAPDTTEEVTESQFGVNSIKTMDSVQKSSAIRNFCTEFLLFAYLAKIKHFYNTKSPAFVFFSPILAF